jgi:hypothetical protein
VVGEVVVDVVMVGSPVIVVGGGEQKTSLDTILDAPKLSVTVSLTVDPALNV